MNGRIRRVGMAMAVLGLLASALAEAAAAQSSHSVRPGQSVLVTGGSIVTVDPDGVVTIRPAPANAQAAGVTQPPRHEPWTAGSAAAWGALGRIRSDGDVRRAHEWGENSVRISGIERGPLLQALLEKRRGGLYLEIEQDVPFSLRLLPVNGDRLYMAVIATETGVSGSFSAREVTDEDVHAFWLRGAEQREYVVEVPSEIGRMTLVVNGTVVADAIPVERTRATVIPVEVRD